MKKKLLEEVRTIGTPASSARLPRLLSPRDLPGITGGDGVLPTRPPQG
jgi:hypothetical protein